MGRGSGGGSGAASDAGDGRSRPAAILENGSGLRIELLQGGTVFAIRHGTVLVNQVLGDPLGGGIGNVYLRRRRRSDATFVPLLGPSSRSRFRVLDGAGVWTGSFDGLDYACTLRLAPEDPSWYWTVRVRNATGRRIVADAVLAQDLGIAQEGAVRSSEAYTSQYIDHRVLEDDALGFVLCSRQNQPQDGAYPWLAHGCVEGAAGYLTDGFQLYGLSYRATGVPAALERRRLPNRVYQYELALPTVQSRPLALPPGTAGEVTFFAAYRADHPAATAPEDLETARAAASGFRRLPAIAPEIPAAAASREEDAWGEISVPGAPVLFPSRDLDPGGLERRFGSGWRHVERRYGELLSFFHDHDRHVVLRAKELVAERPTGLIMQSGRALVPSDDTLSVTAWMSGVFASQLAVGNTSFNQVLSVSRTPLNIVKTSGQRILVRTERGWELLGLPSAFEMGPRGARWIYQDDRFTIVVRAGVSESVPAYRLTVDIERGGPVELLLTHELVLGADEQGPLGRVTVDAAAGRVEMRAHRDTPLGATYPEATFILVSPDAEAIDAIESVGEGGRRLVVRTTPVTRFSLAVVGSLLDQGRAARLAAACQRAPDPETLLAPDLPEAELDGTGLAFSAGSLAGGLGRGAALSGGTSRLAADVARLDDVIPWYLHDALIHYTSPHGLEQYSGAAWGLRDVCQGPVELLVATRHGRPVREILRLVYEHQLRESGDWPQWFMFDRFRAIQGPSSHADIIHWPIKALCDYLELTDDLAILDEQVAWTDATTRELTTETDTLLAHVERQLDRIERDTVPGTSLPVFGGGDWEDTLQPADPEMARRLVSSWTVELAYQSLARFRVVCERAGRQAMADRVAALCERLRADFHRHLVPDGVVAGLAHFDPGGPEYLLHPRDRRTGVSLRLLPMTRGIISGMFTPAQAERHAGLIERHLRFPDGVRLMNRPMAYRGGTSHIFRRAESAANFGREIGLQYVHAHLRYVEAMAVLGHGARALEGLLTVCPILLDTTVPSALPRQANAYFSSSDAAFPDRYQASRRFGEIRTGRVGVKGGWRVYSSGPGIFLGQLIGSVLGLRSSFDDLLFDPVLPPEADGLVFDFAFEGRPVRYRYRVQGRGFSPSEVRVNGTPMPEGRYAANPYRAGGLLVVKQAFLDALGPDGNQVDIVV